MTKPTKRWYEDYPAVKKAMQEVFDLAAGRKRWLMRVPVDRDTDSDCILVDGIKAAYDAGQAAGVASVPYNRLCDCGSGSHVRHCAMCMERYRAAGVALERERADRLRVALEQVRPKIRAFLPISPIPAEQDILQIIDTALRGQP